jgi:hypothetical protein
MLHLLSLDASMTLSALFFIDAGHIGIPGDGNRVIAANTLLLFTQSFAHWGVGRNENDSNDSQRLFFYIRKMTQEVTPGNEFALINTLLKKYPQVDQKDEVFKDPATAILWLLDQSITDCVL